MFIRQFQQQKEKIASILVKCMYGCMPCVGYIYTNPLGSMVGYGSMNDSIVGSMYGRQYGCCCTNGRMVVLQYVCSMHMMISNRSIILL